MVPEYMHEYFTWLIARIDGVYELTPELKELLWEMFLKEFIVVIDRDDNRVADGLGLREIYLNETGLQEDPIGMELDIRPCSVLEVLIGLAERMERDVTGEPGNDHPEEKFWEMVRNLGLVDKLGQTGMDVENVLEDWMYRRYQKSGLGGIFPLKHPPVDQRKTEIWLQMNAYVMENYPIE